MSSESVGLDFIVPRLAKTSEEVQAYFTLKNAANVNQDGRIPGLNIGLNTQDDARRIEQNRSQLFKHLGFKPGKIARGRQVHSNRVRVVDDGGLYPDTDGLVTTVPRLTLAIQVADCAAILIADKKNGVIAAVHAGWRGAASGIVENAFQSMDRQGADTGQMEVFISPCISERHFEVGEEVAEQFPDEVVDRNSYEKPHIDLKQFIQDQLIEQGVSSDAIELHPGCTYDQQKRFYSYRREGNESGRMFAFIQLV